MHYQLAYYVRIFKTLATQLIQYAFLLICTYTGLSASIDNEQTITETNNGLQLTLEINLLKPTIDLVLVCLYKEQ